MGGKNTSTILLILYVALGYWAANQTIYANKVMIGSWGAIVGQKLTVGVLLGWILIPIAIIKLVMGK